MNHYALLQKQLIDGKIKENDLSYEEAKEVGKLFDNQISRLKKENDYLEQKKYKALLSNNEFVKFFQEFKDGLIQEQELNNDQVKQIKFALDMERKSIVNEFLINIKKKTVKNSL